MREQVDAVRRWVCVAAIGCLLGVGTSYAAWNDCSTGPPYQRPHAIAPTYTGVVKVAAVQMFPRLFDKAYNLGVMLARSDEAAANGARLVAFPELALTAYKYLNTAECMQYAETVPGPATEALAAKAAEKGIYIVFGLLEQDGEDVFDTAVLVSPEGFVGKYRKMQMGYHGESVIMSRGNQPPQVFGTDIGRIGMAVCYDGAFPETGRLLGLGGADIMVVIYNESSSALWQGYVRARGSENNAYVVVPNRIGGERLSTFGGKSLIGGPNNQLLAQAGSTLEEIIYADLDLSLLDKSKLAERRPALYDEVADRLPPGILSSDAVPESHVTGTAQDVAVTIVTASIPRGTPIDVVMRSADGSTVASVEGRLGCNRRRLTLPVPGSASAGAYTIEVAVGRMNPATATMGYTVKDVARPTALGKTPYGDGNAIKGTLYVAFDMNVVKSTQVPVQVVGATATFDLKGSINVTDVDNRLSAAYPTLSYGEQYTVIVPAGGVQSVDYGTTNDEVRYTFTVQPAPTIVKMAAVQMEPLPLDAAANLATILAKVSETAAVGAKLVVFPELSLTGNHFADCAAALAVAETIPGPSVDSVVAAAQALGIHVVFGLVEKDAPPWGHGHGEGGCHGSQFKLYNTAVLAGPEGLIGKYRKTHLGTQGDDKIFTAGHDLSPVFDTSLGPLSLMAGYEAYLPEVGRTLGVRGALVVAAPAAESGTLWAELAKVRASENKIYVITANRVGTEDDITYGGLSSIFGATLKVWAQAGSSAEQVIYADLNMFDIQKRLSAWIDRARGKIWETHYYLDRRPQLYELLTWHHRYVWRDFRKTMRHFFIGPHFHRQFEGEAGAE